MLPDCDFKAGDCFKTMAAFRFFGVAAVDAAK
jgi:hypothetical protein